MADIELWRERVAAWRASGLSSTAYCVGRGFSAGGLRHWAHQIKKLDERRARKARPVRLARVVRASSSTTMTPGRSETSVRVPEGSALVLEHQGTCITVWPGYDPATLASVLEVLSRRGGESGSAP